MVNYNAYSKTFSTSRKNMKWEEIEYFLSFLGNLQGKNILDVGCGSGRLLNWVPVPSYVGIDSSSGLLDEAKKDFSEARFLNLDMQDIGKSDLLKKNSFDIIFFIASYHHLDSIEVRKSVLFAAKNLLKDDGYICMTNWALESPINKEKYEKSFIAGSENHFGSKDFDIKIGEYMRYYHNFTLDELHYLFKETGFQVVENRLFDTEKNFISIVKK